MIGKIHRVTYNVVKHVAELHMEDGDIETIPMSDEEWKMMCEGDVCGNFNKLLETLKEEAEKEMEKGPYLLDPITGERTYYYKDEE